MSNQDLLRGIERSLSIIPRFMITSSDGAPYLERIKLAAREDGSATHYLHIIYQSDADRDPHDHPWWFGSKIIHGSYVEHGYAKDCVDGCGQVLGDHKSCPKCGSGLVLRELGPRAYYPGDVNFKAAHELHRLQLQDGPVVTLVERGPKVREWGFWTDRGWKSSVDYLDAKFGKGQWNADYE